MFLLDDAVVYSASDLTQAAACEYALLRKLDHKLGRIQLAHASDAMLERTAALGAAHEAHWKARYVEQFGAWDETTGSGVYEVAALTPEAYRRADRLDAKAQETVAALHAGADVVSQAVFFDGKFHGVADFLVKQADDTYAVYDAKLARHAKVAGVLQLAAYGEQLQQVGIPTAPTVHLVLGDRSITTHSLDDLLPLLRHRRRQLESLLDAHRASPTPAEWLSPGIAACGRCELCEEEVHRNRDLLLVAGLSTVQRKRLRAVGITTIDELASSSGSVDRISAGTLARLRAQASLQVQQNPATGTPGPVHYEVFDPAVIHALPPSSVGDIFFDFEGDPLWTEGASTDAGLEYLFGWVESPDGDSAPKFHTLWAHNRAEEKVALERFIAYLAERRVLFPNLHVFHYAPYETTALKRLAGRHGTCETELDELLRGGVFIDLFSTVRESLRVSQPSYSLKKLEPLYMEARDGLNNAADSITDYAAACETRDRGDRTGFAEQLERIGNYNYDDCRSTYLLREWLLARGAETPRTGPLEEASFVEEEPAAPEPSEVDALIEALHLRADDATDPTDAQAYCLLAAALGYHWREEKPFWWAHFDRLSQPIDEWAPSGDVFRCDESINQAPTSDWQAPVGRKRNWRRTVQVSGETEPGSTIRVGTKMWPVYEHPTDSMSRSSTGTRGWNHSGIEVTAIDSNHNGASVLTVEENAKVPEWSAPPIALVPKPGPNHGVLRDAIADLCTQVVAQPSFPASAALQILRRQHPHGVAEVAQELRQTESAEVIPAITHVLTGMTGSYVAVQGPPGTGKTYTGSRVIRDLVQRGWKIGVVAQSHAVVENFLTAALEAGVPPDVVAKKPAGGDQTERPWRTLGTNGDWVDFLAADSGRIVGGTAWDFANRKRIASEQLDLLVIDEAGQFSLANTLAVAGSAHRLLLLGDPQQLPQVSQGTHPFPVDESALGWLVDGHPTMPDGIGFFLDKTFRMHPELCEPVSDLSYAGLLAAMPLTGQRNVAGMAPGLHLVPVEHTRNRTESPEEAQRVVELVHNIVGSRWQDPDRGQDRDLTGDDVIVVAAYNAQVGTLRAALRAADFTEVRVGTVDKFQGQEAPVAIVSLAASSAQEVPRGMEFLINRNRLNVAISRGKYAAFLVQSPALWDYLPADVDALEELGAFIRLGTHGRE